MADLSRKEFAALCHTTVAVITTNIKRRKVILIEDTDLIDTTNPTNKGFFDRYMLLKSKRVSETISNNIVKPVVQQKQKVNKKVRAKANKEAQEKEDWILRKQKADTVLQEKRVAKEELNIKKLGGKLLPTDLVFNIVKIHNQSIFATFQNDLENLGSIYCDILASGDRSKLSEIMEKIALKLSDSVERAEDVALSSLNNAIDDYSQTRNRGERK